MSNCNRSMIQLFHWNLPAEGTFWRQVSQRACELADAGVTDVWLPPAYKGFSGADDVGYGVYDLYDLGEFHQKGSIRTKYGTRNEYIDAIRSLKSRSISVYADAVLNHRIGGDATEFTQATPYDRYDLSIPKGDLRSIESYTYFNFPGRRKKYSGFEWHWWHFDAVDFDKMSPSKSTIYVLQGKNFDMESLLHDRAKNFVLGNAVDLQDETVQRELIAWGKWYLDCTGVDGFRLDSLKFNLGDFFVNWLDEMACYSGKSIYAVGELWHQDLVGYLDSINNSFPLFDFPLQANFRQASWQGNSFDMRRILDGTLIQNRPAQAVTFVENHDTLTMPDPVQQWFKPLAYALLMLFGSEGLPCIFLGDYDGTWYERHDHSGNSRRIEVPSMRQLLDTYLKLRNSYGHLKQITYFDHHNTVGWTRMGSNTHQKAFAVLMSNGNDGWKWMDTCRSNSRFVDVTGQISGEALTNDWGWGEFKCRGRSVSVWVEVTQDDRRGS